MSRTNYKYQFATNRARLPVAYKKRTGQFILKLGSNYYEIAPPRSRWLLIVGPIV